MPITRHASSIDALNSPIRRRIPVEDADAVGVRDPRKRLMSTDRCADRARLEKRGFFHPPIGCDGPTQALRRGWPSPASAQQESCPLSKSEQRAQRRRTKRAKHAKKRAAKGRAAKRPARTQQSAAPALFEELEPRILFSTLTGMDPDASLLDANYAPGGEVIEADAALDADEASTGVAGYEQLVEDIRSANPEGRELEVVLLDSEQDGIEQITDFLRDHEDLDAIHIVSHGSEGAAQLGNAWLTNDSLSSYEGAIGSWADALSEDADLLFYGCDLAAGESGQALVDSISKLTGADVAASIDDTGAAVLGGDWDLEYRAGDIETAQEKIR